MPETKLCIICNEGSTPSSKKLISSSEMIADLVTYCNERLSLGELEIKPLCDRMNSLSESENSSVYYHSECRKPLVNKVNIEGLQKFKAFRSDSPVASNSLRKRGRPSHSGNTPRPKRTKKVTKAQLCMFSSSNFCPTEMSVVPRSLCAVDGSLYIPTDKASLMHVIEAAKSEPRVPDLPETTAIDYRDRALAVDAMAELQSMKKTPTMRTLADLKETVVKRIENMLNGFHEETDTLIPNQVLAYAAKQPCREICVLSPDTDVFILLIDPVSRGLLAPQTRLKFLTGKGRTFREIDIIERVCVIGARKCQGFVGLHNFSGADWGGKFVGISKKTLVDAYMSLDEDDPAIDCFRNLAYPA